jgi:hypothetical protein
MLTPTEIARLEGKESEDNNNKVSAPHKRYNDMVVRNKIKQWLEDGKDVLFALEKLQGKQIKKHFSDEDDAAVFDLINVVMALIRSLGFDKIKGDKIENAKAIRLVNRSGEFVCLTRDARKRDFERNSKLFFVIQMLKNHTAYSPALEEWMKKNFLEMWKIEDENENMIPLRYVPTLKENQTLNK